MSRSITLLAGPFWSLILVWIAGGCAVQPVESEFLADPAGVETTLAASCSPAEVTPPLWITVSDQTGHTYVAEPENDRVWVRDPFGSVSDQCYWVNTDPDRPEWPETGRPACFEDGLAQDGTCTGDEARPDGTDWTFIHGGFIEVPGLRGRLATHDDLAVTWSGEEHPVLRMVDMVPDGSDCPETQHPWFFHRVSLSLVLTAGLTGFADGDLAITGEHLLGLSPENRKLAVWDLPLPCENDDPLPEPTRVDLPCAPDGPIAVDPAGDRLFALCSSVATVLTISGFDTESPSVEGRSLMHMAQPTDLAYDPVSETLWIASPDAAGGRVRRIVLQTGATTAFAIPGASQLAVGQTEVSGATSSRVYAIGEGHPGVYRFDPLTDDVAVQDIGEPLLAIGAGYEAQEIAVVTQRTDGSVGLRSFLDAGHLAAQVPGSLHISAAAFLEFPRDPALDNEAGLRGEIAMEPEPCADIGEATSGWPDLDRTMYQVCCLQRARADHLALNLDYLETAVLDRIEGEADGEILLGINPTVLLQSAHCIHAGLELGHDELSAFGLPLLEVVGDRISALIDRGEVVPVLLVHTSAGTEDQVHYTCPELWQPDLEDPDCDVAVEDQDAYRRFLEDLFEIATLAPLVEEYQGTGGCGPGELPLPGGCVDLSQYAIEMEGIAGGFDRAMGLNLMHEDISWPDAFAETFPGSREPFTYFGGGGNYSMVANAISKELAPWDARQRISPFLVSADARVWDEPSVDGPLHYFSGVTVAHPYLYEWSRSGLFVMDAVWHGSTSADVWATDAWAGDESTDTMNEADFAVLDHYLTYRLLSSRRADAQRVFYLHLPDIGGISLALYADGRVDCTDPEHCDERDALQDWITQTLPQLGPAVVWGLPEEYR